MKLLNLITVFFFFIIINGCSTSSLWNDKEFPSGKSRPMIERKIYDSYLIKTKNNNFFIKFSSDAGDNLRNKYLLISNEGTEFYNNFNNILNLPEYIQITSLNIIIDGEGIRESIVSHKGFDQTHIKMDVSVGFKINLSQKNKPVFIDENNISKSYDLNRFPAINNDDCSYKLRSNPFINLIIMDQWKKEFSPRTFDLTITSYFKSFLDDTGNMIEAPCSFVLDEIKNDQKDYLGALFFTKIRYKDGYKESNYVKLPMNIKKLMNVSEGYSYYLSAKEQSVNETEVLQPTASTILSLGTDEYFIRFSQDYTLDKNIVNELSTSLSKLTFKDIPTTIIIPTQEKYPLVLKIIATPFTVVADIVVGVILFVWVLLGGLRPG